jgi:glyoxylase-like metal-dependent hydrolase (beta-lactamase superfamily II)
MADPAKLLESAGRLYGDTMERLYGAFLAVPQENLRVLQGGESLSIGKCRLDVVYTPGHARHHVCYFDSSEGVAFVGDTVGIRIQGDTFVLPATPPPDVDLELWKSSLAAISSRRPDRLFVTHFGFSDDPEAHVDEFRRRLHDWGSRARQLLRVSRDEGSALRAFVESVRAEVEQCLPAPEIAHYLFNGGVDLSWLGLARYWRKRAAVAGRAS